MNKETRLLYLGFSLPYGLRQLFPGINPAGNAFETQMLGAVRPLARLRTVGLVPFSVKQVSANDDPNFGAPHDLLLVEKPPELWHRLVALRRLKRKYRAWQAEGWQPDTVLVYNMTPVYNAFIRWLRRQSDRPRLVLLLLDSDQLGRRISRSKKLRYRFKPLIVPDEDMLGKFDACIGLSASTERYAKERGMPFLWMPGACTPERAPRPPAETLDGPLRFGYFGSLGAHGGALEMTRLFLSTPGQSELHVCGYGKTAGEFENLARQSARLKFYGLLPQGDCLRFGQACDVLVNPRPVTCGNENNMASKLFDYGLCQRAIITARLSGADRVLGPEVFYFDPHHFAEGLRAALLEAVKTPRVELHRRGALISERVMGEYNWPRQAARMMKFMERH